MFYTDGERIPIACLFTPAYPTERFLFDVEISNHDEVKLGNTCTEIIQVMVTDVKNLNDAFLLATQIAGSHGMPTRTRLVRVEV